MKKKAYSKGHRIQSLPQPYNLLCFLFMHTNVWEGLRIPPNFPAYLTTSVTFLRRKM